MSRTFGWTPAVVLELPMRLFWEYSGQVERLVACEQRQLLQVFAAAHAGGDAARAMQETLDRLAPDPVTVTGFARMQATAQPDPGAINTLRALAG